LLYRKEWTVYASADIIISRAGVQLGSELYQVSLVLFLLMWLKTIKLKNAKAIVDKKGALLLKESELEYSLVF
jgi:UDP-N-acetylglucosamine--N-acetylmuramyl-(pentapeptide) pyrophosphoryl-undecaprenol N-acetylglucosamine transferase